MPELPEVETVRRGLAPAMTGQRIARAEARRADLRFALPARLAERLTGARIINLTRRAKYLVAELDTDEALIMHLGMTGRFTLSSEQLGAFVHAAGRDSKHDHIVLDLENGVRVTFNDARRFGFFEMWPLGELDAYPAFAALGPEPMSNAFNGPYLLAAFRGKKTPIKAALLDQRVVAGLGNIYVCEALFRSRVSPKRLAGSLGPARAERLAGAVRTVIHEAIEAGGSSISDFAATDGSLGYFQHGFQVYGREGQACLSCARAIKRLVQSGRSTFYCSTCQR